MMTTCLPGGHQDENRRKPRDPAAFLASIQETLDRIGAKPQPEPVLEPVCLEPIPEDCPAPEPEPEPISEPIPEPIPDRIPDPIPHPPATPVCLPALKLGDRIGVYVGDCPIEEDGAFLSLHDHLLIFADSCGHVRFQFLDASITIRKL